jgi:trans-aconitate 2-methyltransferase
VDWNPKQYLRYSDERALPFRHLVAAIGHLEPRTVADLGCGPGGLTATLLERWPTAHIVGVDTSQEMIDHAQRREITGRLAFELGDARSWRAGQSVDLILSNACFHWIDDHRALFDHLAPQLADGGVLAFQVPANHAEPSHTLLRELCSNPRWSDRLDGLPRTGVREPWWYLAELGDRGLRVTVWQTTYFHLLEGKDPVLEWVRGTALRPVLERLRQEEHETFIGQYGALLRAAYPARDGRTLFPFKRTFVVSVKV